MAKIVVSGPFDGPNFVDGLSKQKNNYTVINSTTAILQPPFAGGMDPSVTYTMTLHGTGFGVDSNGRFTGIVTSFDAVDNSQPDTSWTVTGYNTPLDIVNTNATAVDFVGLLVSPVQWKYIGNEYDDTFIGGPFVDILKGNDGNDAFQGLGGDDLLEGGKGLDTLNGDEGNDTIKGGHRADTINGGTGDDLIKGNHGDDAIDGAEGVDTISGASGNDAILGGEGGDDIDAGDGVDNVDGGSGADLIRGGGGDDMLLGGLEGDSIFGDDGNDYIEGGVGVDDLYGGKGRDTLLGGDDTDQLFGNKSKDILEGGAASDYLTGGPGNDLLSGNVSGTPTPDESFDAYFFKGKFGDDKITDYEIGYDQIVLQGYRKKDVTIVEGAVDVTVIVDYKGTQTILVENVAGQFDADADLVFA
jgi:Ca2+-binding RTX toxin-like protein